MGPRAGHSTRPFWGKFLSYLDAGTGIPYIYSMRTVIETPTFQKQVDKLWSEEERLEFITWIASNPKAGDVIPGAGGIRKVRWSRPGTGKSGGVRVIFCNLTEEEAVLLIAIYAKSDRNNMTSSQIRKMI